MYTHVYVRTGRNILFYYFLFANLYNILIFILTNVYVN